MIRASQNRKGQILPVLFWSIARPAAWPFTYVFANLGFGPNGVTSFRLFIGLLSFVLIALTSGSWYTIGVAFFFLTIVLDNADGQLARVQDTASYFGKMYDGVVDSVIEIGFPLALGFHFYLTAEEPLGFVIGTVAAISHAMTQLLMVRYGLMSANYRSAGAPTVACHPKLKRLYASKSFVSVSHALEQVLPLLVWDFRVGGFAIAIAFNAEWFFLAALACGQFGMLLCFAGLRLLRAYHELDAHRFSSTSTDRPHTRVKSPKSGKES
jgi:phosphatidylglycerophosphate synthase